MGGSQSQERVIGIEEGPGADGGPQIIVTEDFVKHISDRSSGVSENKRSAPDRYESKNDDDEDVFTPSAEQLLVGERYSRDDTYLDSDEESRWKRKFDLEQQKNSNLKTLSSEAFDEAVNEIRDQFSSKMSNNIMPVCEDCRDRVDECYQQNRAKPLMCSTLVKDYVQCVEKHRKGLLQAPSQV